jgi:hypothetical protein
MLKGVLGIDYGLDGLHTTSFAARLPKVLQEIEIIRARENNPNMIRKITMIVA